MALHPRTLAKAAAHVAAADPKLGAVIRTVGRCTLRVRDDLEPFPYLARVIVFQQLSTGAATTIHGRFAAQFRGGVPTPRAVLALADEDFRAAGVSSQKMRYLRDLAAHARDGALPLDDLPDMADDEVIATLTRVKGIGRWTAQMYLIFRLGRLDVLPELDLGVQKGLQRAHALRRRPTPKRLAALAACWAPYRSVGAWYCWRALETDGW